MFLHVQSIQTLKIDFFFQVPFFYIKCTPFLMKIKEDSNIDA